MKKRKDLSGLFFSAFLITAFVVCSYFFVGIINDQNGLDPAVRTLLKALVFVLFGLILFYATRVGEGKQVKRFSLAALILVDLPAIYLILASCFSFIPLPFDISGVPETMMIAAVALGYGVPYTFLSGYELDRSDEKAGEKAQETPEEKTESSDEGPADEEAARAEEAVGDSDNNAAEEADNNAEALSPDEKTAGAQSADTDPDAE